ncbi:MAG: 2-amino-4-hydroxy-6-hydroxymethyldihydropteridine diphosphokinase [Chloroflexi bacterium]|nr:2-amino-4-hydroxy-6-hydroxymethyldihydropteridine diphosphokinase [Chloroflexota bacterium]
MTPHPPNTPLPALLVLGSNMGDRLGFLRVAVAGLGMVGRIDAVSPIYESPPSGHVHQGPFLNLALRLTTGLGPVRLLMWGKGLEFAAGRRPGIPYGPRPLDVDIVSLGGLEIVNRRVSIPHPRVAERPFMTAPLADIAPSETLAGHDATLAELDRRLGREDLAPVAGPDAVWTGPPSP